MNVLRKFILISVTAFSFTSFDVSAAVDPAATVVLLRTSCNDGSGGTLNNCFTATSGLVSWITSTRSPKPNASAPLTVQIGPGAFSPLNLTCNASAGFTGYIKFAGAGRSLSRFVLPGSGFAISSPAVIKNCTGLAFSDLKMESRSYGYIDWSGGGTSVWENVDVSGQSRGWFETSCGSQPGSHYWFNSRISSSGFGVNTPYLAGCDKSWFYGSEIVTGALGPLLAAGGPAELHVYGSNLRVDDSDTSNGPISGNVAVATASSNAAIHIHGTGIDASGGVGRTVKVLSADSGGSIHADVSAYNLSAGSGGTVIRIDNGGGTGHVHAPYLWQHIPDPATIPNYTSTNGADQSTVTLGTSDGYPHSIVYSSKCVSTTTAATPWWDPVDKICR